MADARFRDLERQAATGGLEEGRAFSCYRIGKLNIEIPLEPSLLSKVGKEARGRYNGQTLWNDSDSGITHPCIKWQTDDEEQFWDVVSEECVWKRPTHAVTLSIGPGCMATTLSSMILRPGPGRWPSLPRSTLLVPTPAPGEPGIMAALREAPQNNCGECLLEDQVIESPHILPGQVLLLQQPARTFLGEYPAQFENDVVTAFRGALSSNTTLREQGDDDEAEG